MITEEERTKKYQELSPVLQNLYGAPQSGATMYAVFIKHSLEEWQYQKYAEIVGDTILGFNKISDMPRLFQQKLSVSADESQRITSSLIEFLAPVVAREEEEARVKKESVSTLTEAISKPDPQRLQDPQLNQYADNVEPIRTMAEDMHRVHGYGAYTTPTEEIKKEESADDNVEENPKDMPNV